MITIAYGKQPLYTIRTEGKALYDADQLRLFTYGTGYQTELNDSSEIFQSLMGDHYIKLDFYTEDYVDVPVGAFVFYEGKVWTITTKQQPTPVGAGWHYTLQFDAPEMQMRRFLIAYTGQGRREMSFAITTDLATAAKVVCDCMNSQDNPNDYKWEVGECVKGDGAGEISTLSFNGETCFDACSLIADIFKTEWYATYGEDNTVVLNFKKCEVGESVDFKVGETELLDAMTPQGGNDKDHGTRFWCFGSTRNIDYSYIKAHLTESDHTALSTISEPRLLPKDDSGKYVNPIYAKNGQVVSKEDLPEGEYIDRMVFFEDEYPKTDTTITGVRTREVTFSDSDEKYTAYIVECTNADFFKGEKSILKGQTLAMKFNDSNSDLYGWEFDLAYKGAQHMVRVSGEGSVDNPKTSTGTVTIPAQEASVVQTVEMPLATFESDYIGQYMTSNGSNGLGQFWFKLPAKTRMADFAPFIYLHVRNSTTGEWSLLGSVALSKGRAQNEDEQYTEGYVLSIPNLTHFATYVRDLECRVSLAAKLTLFRTFEGPTPTEAELRDAVLVDYKMVGYGKDLLVTSKPTEAVKEFEIVPQTMGKDVDGKTIVVPNAYQKPAIGNVFTLLNVEIPDANIVAAEKHLHTTACGYAVKHSSDTNVYSCETNVVVTGQSDTEYGLGQRVRLVNAHLFGFMGGSRASRIQEYTKNFIFPFKATYVVGDNTAYSYTGEIKSEGEDAAYSQRIGVSGRDEGSRIIGTADNTTPSNENIYSALKMDKMLSLYLLKEEANKYFSGGAPVGGGGDIPIHEDEDGNYYLDGNFYTTGWLASKGKGEEAEGSGFSEEKMWLALGATATDHRIGGSFIKIDGNTIKVNADGALYSVGGGGSEPPDLSNYCTKDYISTNYYSKTEINGMGFLTWGSLYGYATEYWVSNNYYTKTDIDNKGFLTQHQSLYGYATEYWVSQNFVSATALSGYMKKNQTESTSGVVTFTSGIKIGNVELYQGNDGRLYITRGVVFGGDVAGTR